MEENKEMNNGEIIKNALEDFEKIQKYMILAKKENATAGVSLLLKSPYFMRFSSQ